MDSMKMAPLSSPKNSDGSFDAPIYHVSFSHDRVDFSLPSYPVSTSQQERRISRRMSIRPAQRRLSNVPAPQPPQPGKGRGRDFWLVFIAVCSSTFLEALDFTTVSTALPTIVRELRGADKFPWIGAAYTLSTTAFLPLTGVLADVLGRRPCMLGSLVLFAIGSAVCGAAVDMPMLIAGRTVQGMGAAGIGSLSDIIVADLVPLKERGTFMGFLAAVWAVASAIGPSLGGVFAEKLSWRWLFYINLPLTAFSLVLVFFFLKLKTPTDHILHKLGRVDWLGSVIIIGGATSAVIALVWGGSVYPWASYQVLIPLIIGVLTTTFFFYYEKRWAKEPSVPFELLTNRTSLSGYLGTFCHGIMSTALVYYLPLYFQAVKGHTPTRAGVDMLEASLTIAPVAIIVGVSVAVFNRYRVQNYVGWIVSIVGFGLLSLLKADTRGVQLAGLQILAAIGVGILYASVTFPILAPLGVSENAHALAFFLFVRTFSYGFGIAIGGTVLQNELQKRLPVEFMQLFPPHQDVAYSAVDLIHRLDAAQQRVIRAEFAGAIAMIWRVLIGIAGAGLLSCFIMKEIPMSEELDEQWQIDQAAAAVGERDVEQDLDVTGVKPKAHITRVLEQDLERAMDVNEKGIKSGAFVVDSPSTATRGRSFS